MWKSIKHLFRGQRGQLEVSGHSIPPILIWFLAIIVVVVFLPSINIAVRGGNWTIAGALAYLEENGYNAYADPAGTLTTKSILPDQTAIRDIGSVGDQYRNTWFSGNVTAGAVYQDGFQVPKAPGAPDYVVGVNTATDDVAGSTGYWVKSGAAGQVVETNADGGVSFQWAINTANSSGGGNIKVVGTIATTTQISAKSNVNVDMRGAIINCTSTSADPTIMFDGTSTNITNAEWIGGEIHRIGVTHGNTPVVRFQGNVARSVKLRYCEIYNDATSDYNNTIGVFGIVLINNWGTSPYPATGFTAPFAISPTIENCNVTLTAGDSFGNDIAIALWTIGRNSAPIINHCTGKTTMNGGTSAGLLVTEECSRETIISDCIFYGGQSGVNIGGADPTLDHVIGIAGDVGGGGGFFIQSGNPVLNNCEGYAGHAAYSYGLTISKYWDNAPCPVINGGIFSPKIYNLEYVVDLTNETLPDGGLIFDTGSGTRYVMVIDGWSILAIGTNPGVTLTLGTGYLGNNNIVNAISVTDPSGELEKGFIPAAYGYSDKIYGVLSGNFTGHLAIWFHLMDYPVGSGGLEIADTGLTAGGVINGATIYGCGPTTFGPAVYLANNTFTTKFQNCNIKNLTGGNAIQCAAGYTNLPFYNCSIEGTLGSVTSFAKGGGSSGSGTWVVPNAQTSVVVTHGLGWTPVVGDIAIGFTSLGNSVSCYIDTYTSENFTVHVNADPGASTATGWWKVIR